MTEPDWFDRIGQAGWQHVVFAVLTAVTFCALWGMLIFAPQSTCSISSTDTPTTTTVNR